MFHPNQCVYFSNKVIKNIKKKFKKRRSAISTEQELNEVRLSNSEFFLVSPNTHIIHAWE
jgi:hypothetical protein